MSRPTPPLESQFSKLGARVQVREIESPSRFLRDRRLAWSLPNPAPLRIDVRKDRHGEYFRIDRQSRVSIDVADVRSADRHLLLIATIPDDSGRTREAAYLCGRDERHWFVAAIPENSGAYDVQHAKDALKPPQVWDAMAAFNVPMWQRDQRRTAAFVRQGEWFFIPTPDLKVSENESLRDEPIQRGGGKPHICQFLYRTDGELVYVRPEYPNGLTQYEFECLPKPQRRRHGWRTMVRGARVYVKGYVRHPDHKTVWLGNWHEVVMNRETEAKAMQNLAFLD